MKKQFSILESGAEPRYSVHVQKQIIISCIIHTFLMSVDSDADLIEEVDNELANQDQHVVEYHENIGSDQEIKKAEWIRDYSLAAMGRDYTSSS